MVSFSPVIIFHKQIDLSTDPETMCWPSGENATEVTKSECPLNGPATVSPVMVFHTQIVLSLEPETMCWPSGENATEFTKFECPLNGPACHDPSHGGSYVAEGAYFIRIGLPPRVVPGDFLNLSLYGLIRSLS